MRWEVFVYLDNDNKMIHYHPTLDDLCHNVESRRRKIKEQLQMKQNPLAQTPFHQHQRRISHYRVLPA